MCKGFKVFFTLLVVFSSQDSRADRCADFFSRMPAAIQETSYTCGPAALASVLGFFGIEPPAEAELALRLNTEPDHGTAHYSLKRVAHEFGLSAEVKHRIDLAHLEKYLRDGKAVIVSIQAWGDGHWVVVERIDQSFVRIMDPYGPDRFRNIPLGEFIEGWKDPKSEKRDFEAIVISKKRQSSSEK